jgi:ADP-ribosylglycohydrolase
VGGTICLEGEIMKDNTMKKNIINGIMGACVADALGVPVEFESRN